MPRPPERFRDEPAGTGGPLRPSPGPTGSPRPPRPRAPPHPRAGRVSALESRGPGVTARGGGRRSAAWPSPSPARGPALPSSRPGPDPPPAPPESWSARPAGRGQHWTGGTLDWGGDSGPGRGSGSGAGTQVQGRGLRVRGRGLWVLGGAWGDCRRPAFSVAPAAALLLLPSRFPPPPRASGECGAEPGAGCTEQSARGSEARGGVHGAGSTRVQAQGGWSSARAEEGGWGLQVRSAGPGRGREGGREGRCRSGRSETRAPPPSRI